jgi:hypothetical protein
VLQFSTLLGPLDTGEHEAVISAHTALTEMRDLIQFWPAERSYRLIEVKGPGDRLKDNQRGWLRFFAQHGIPAAV